MNFPTFPCAYLHSHIQTHSDTLFHILMHSSTYTFHCIVVHSFTFKHILMHSVTSWIMQVWLLLLVAPGGFQTLLMQSKAYVLHRFLGHFVVSLSKGNKIWAKLCGCDCWTRSGSGQRLWLRLWLQLRLRLRLPLRHCDYQLRLQMWLPLPLRLCGHRTGGVGGGGSGGGHQTVPPKATVRPA